MSDDERRVPVWRRDIELSDRHIAAILGDVPGVDEDAFEGLPGVDPDSTPAVEAPAYPPRGGWQGAVREKEWELVAEVPDGAYYLDLRPKAAEVILVRPRCKPRNFSAALFFGVEMRREAVRWAKGKARAAAKKPPRKQRNNGPL